MVSKQKATNCSHLCSRRVHVLGLLTMTRPQQRSSDSKWRLAACCSSVPPAYKLYLKLLWHERWLRVTLTDGSTDQLLTGSPLWLLRKMHPPLHLCPDSKHWPEVRSDKWEIRDWQQFYQKDGGNKLGLFFFIQSVITSGKQLRVGIVLRM